MLTREFHFRSSHQRDEHITTISRVKKLLHLPSLMAEQRQVPASTAALKWPEHGHFNTIFVSEIKAISAMDSWVKDPSRDNEW